MKAINKNDTVEIDREYDFSKGNRGKHHKRLQNGYTVTVYSQKTYNSDTRIKSVDFKGELLIVGLMDGRLISVPIIFYPRLFIASKEQRKNWKISGGGYGIHWSDIDEDLSSEGLLRGAPAPAKSHSLVK